MSSTANSHHEVSTRLVRSRRFFRPSRGLRARVRRVASLRPPERQAMWQLLQGSYGGLEPTRFEEDLEEKDHVVLLTDVHGALQGFSTLLQMQVGSALAVFSGDTVVAPRAWGQTALQRAFVWYLVALRHAQPERPLYWFLVSKGYRTYLLLTRYFPNHWPRVGQQAPAEAGELLDRLCRTKFGAAWDASAGVVRHAGKADHLVGALATVPARLLRDPDVAYFLERNPRWAEGDELACLAKADDAFVSKATRIFL